MSGRLNPLKTPGLKTAKSLEKLSFKRSVPGGGEKKQVEGGLRTELHCRSTLFIAGLGEMLSQAQAWNNRRGDATAAIAKWAPDTS